MSGVRKVSTLTLHAAQIVMDACVKKADELGKPMGIVVVDVSGRSKVVVNMDDAPLLVESVARRKAWSAAAWDMETVKWVDFIGDDAVLQHGIPHIEGLTTLGGGIPLRVQGVLVGGVGVSGSHYTEDISVAQAGADAFHQQFDVSGPA